MEARNFRDYLKETDPSTTVRKDSCRKTMCCFLEGQEQMDFPSGFGIDNMSLVGLKTWNSCLVLKTLVAQKDTTLGKARCLLGERHMGIDKD